MLCAEVIPERAISSISETLTVVNWPGRHTRPRSTGRSASLSWSGQKEFHQILLLRTPYSKVRGIPQPGHGHGAR